MRQALSMTVVTLLIGLVGSALAVDFWGGPPEDTWTRGGEGTTYQHWDFSDPGWFTPEEWFNPYGEPSVEYDPADWEWGIYEAPPEIGSPDGFVDGIHCFNPDGGTITLIIPNTEDPMGAKWIFMQVTSSKVPSGVTTSGSGGNPAGYTSSTWPTGLPQIQHPGPAPFNGQWYTYNYGLKITPNPQSETITIEVPFCTVIDQIVVDTICTTDPVAAEEHSWGRVKSLFR
jgi:hypothetical protein